LRPTEGHCLVCHFFRRKYGDDARDDDIEEFNQTTDLSKQIEESVGGENRLLK